MENINSQIINFYQSFYDEHIDAYIKLGHADNHITNLKFISSLNEQKDGEYIIAMEKYIYIDNYVYDYGIYAITNSSRLISIGLVTDKKNSIKLCTHIDKYIMQNIVLNLCDIDMLEIKPPFISPNDIIKRLNLLISHKNDYNPCNRIKKNDQTVWNYVEQLSCENKILSDRLASNDNIKYYFSGYFSGAIIVIFVINIFVNNDS